VSTFLDYYTTFLDYYKDVCENSPFRAAAKPSLLPFRANIDIFNLPFRAGLC